MFILFLDKAKNDCVSYDRGDIKEVDIYSSCMWVLDNTEKGYRKTIPVSSNMKYVVAPNSGDVIKAKSLLFPELLSKSEKEFLIDTITEKENNSKSVEKIYSKSNSKFSESARILLDGLEELYEGYALDNPDTVSTSEGRKVPTSGKLFQEWLKSKR